MFMGGVDRGDQVHGYYSCRTKCRKFYKYIFHFLLDVAITNAFILQKHYCRADSPHKTILEFCLKLAKKLIGDYCSRRRPGRGAGVIRSLPLRHFPTTIPVDDPTQKPNTSEGDAHVAWTRRKSMLTHRGTVQSVMFGCVTLERRQQTVSCCGIPAVYKYLARCCNPKNLHDCICCN